MHLSNRLRKFEAKVDICRIKSLFFDNKDRFYSFNTVHCTRLSIILCTISNPF